MTPSSSQQFLGNICVAIAAMIYAIPLQALLRELQSKRAESGGIIAGLLLLAPMWLLLIIAVSCVTASGGLAWLKVQRTTLFALTVLGAVTMGVVSFGLRFEMPRDGTAIDRVIGQVPIHLFPLLTIGLAIVGLNPRVAALVPLGVISQAWGAVAGLTIALCAGLLGYQLLFAGGQRVVGLGSTLGAVSAASSNDVARIATLDPAVDFDELARLTGEFNRAGVRSAAMVRLRQAPDFIATLAAQLTNGTASSGAADHALAVVAMDAFTAEEQQRIAEPARSAMQRITAYVRSDFSYITKGRRQFMRKSWGKMFRTIAAKLASTGVDFPSTVAAFDRALDGPKD